MAPRGRAEEKTSRSLGVVDVVEGPIRWVDVPKGTWLDANDEVQILSVRYSRPEDSRDSPRLAHSTTVTSPVTFRSGLSGISMDIFQNIIPGRLPIDSEILFLIENGVPTDDSRAEQELGMSKRPLEETMTDMIRWMHSTGRISDKQAGRLAG